MNESSTFRQHSQPAERVTAHKVLGISQRLKGEDAKTLRALAYQMMDEEKQARQYVEVLQKIRDAAKDCRTPDMLRIVAECADNALNARIVKDESEAK